MAKPNLTDLSARAKRAIERNEDIIHDVAGETGNIVGNVKHMYWFERAVALELCVRTAKWSHLYGAMNSIINQGRKGPQQPSVSPQGAAQKKNRYVIQSNQG